MAQLHDPQGQPVGAYRVFQRPGDLLPGLAMSRSLGDALAHSLGVVAKPAFKSYRVQPNDLCVVRRVVAWVEGWLRGWCECRF